MSTLDPDRISEFTRGERSFVPGLTPPEALQTPVSRLLEILRDRYGSPVDKIVTGAALSPDFSPVSGETSPDWIRTQNILGINVRTVGTFWRIVHYSLTVPDTFSAVHLLPVWEPGVVGSLYGIAGWQLNGEFLDEELAGLCPALNTPARQLRAVVDMLHVTGRAVGMEVIPHTDRFSEIVLANPAYFEWLRRSGTRITDHRSNLHEEVEQLLREYLNVHGPAAPSASGSSSTSRDDYADLFSDSWTEHERNAVLFGNGDDPDTRGRRRGEIIRFVHSRGYEPVPATMGPPYRGLEVDPDAGTANGEGETWIDYRITKPQEMSRVFGPLTRYKLYERKNDNADWEIDFDRPRTEVWDYVAGRYGAVQEQFGFDFMRGDMSHVQMRPEGVPAEVPEYYDLLAHVKHTITARLPSFSYFAETFLSPPGIIAFGNEVDHLEACDADVTLGDLQSVPVAADAYSRRLRQYLDIAGTRTVTPCLTMMTGDKDDPRFDEFYLTGNEFRLFLGLMIPDMPSYMALGFELRDPHPEPAPNEMYTKLFVFRQTGGKNATHGPYQFGKNTGLFERLQRIHVYASEVLKSVAAGHARWILPPDATAGRKQIAWLLHGSSTDRICVCNCDTIAAARNIRVPGNFEGVAFEFSTIPEPRTIDIHRSRRGFHIERLGRGECRVYTVGRVHHG